MVIENESNDVLDTEYLSSATIRMADAYNITDHSVNTTNTEMLRNNSIQPEKTTKENHQ